MLTWILEVVLGSRSDYLILFHNILNPEPALMMNILFKDCKKKSSIRVNPEDVI